MHEDEDEWRHSNIGRLLNNAVRRFELRIFELLAADGHGEATLSQLSLTRNLDRSGTRITELARRATMTKQAMSELVGQCERRGLVTTAPDPRDARAKLVLFTDLGHAWLSSFRDAVHRAEDEMRTELGVKATSSLSTSLARYGARFDPLGLDQKQPLQEKPRAHARRQAVNPA